MHALLLSLVVASIANAGVLSCKNPNNYTYFMDDPALAAKCRYNYDEWCNFKSTVNNCKWIGKVYPDGKVVYFEPQKEDKPVASVTETSTATKTEVTTPPTETVVEAGTETATGTETDIETDISGTKPKPETAKTPKPINFLELARKEVVLAAQKVKEMKITLEELKVSNQNNAILYRSPDANLGNVDPRFNAFNAGVSGEISASGAAGGLLANAFKSTKPSSREKSGRGLASKGNGEIELGKAGDKSGASSGENSSAASDNPWVSYMDQTSKAGLIDRLRKNPGLRDSLRDRIAELQAKGDASGIVELMEEALASAEKESQAPNLDDLKPMGIMEAFSMDAGETEAQIRSLLADLDTESDPQFLPQTSLFERVSVAHRRSQLRGLVKAGK